MVCYNPLLGRRAEAQARGVIGRDEKALSRIGKSRARKHKPLTATEMLEGGQGAGITRMGKHFTHQIEDSS